MPRPRYPQANQRLPPPLSPGERTVGQLVAEALRLYGRRFWPALALGVPVAVVNLLAIELSGIAALVVVPLVAAALLTISAVGACVLARPEPTSRRRMLTAASVGAVVFLPFPLLAALYVLPGLAYLSLLGLAVPAAVNEGTGFGGSFRRGLRLARADFVHTLGGLATLAILVFLTQTALYAALRAQGEQAAAAASFIAGIVISPLLFLGVALLYVDQAARLELKQAS